MGEMRIIIVQCVRNRAVGKGGRTSGIFVPFSDNRCDRLTPLLPHEIAHDTAQLLVRASPCADQLVEK
jgi:hypothetical protein